MILRWKKKTYRLEHGNDSTLQGVEIKSSHRISLQRRPTRPQVWEVIPHSRETKRMAKFYFIQRDGIFDEL